jgi:pyruvate,water dikinase
MSSTEVVEIARPAGGDASPDFPVRWENPDDARLSWRQDRMHTPDPVLPMEQTFWDLVYAGFNRAAEAYELPGRLRIRCINTYLYMAMTPVVPPERMEAQGRRAERRIDEAMARLREAWTGEWLPEIRAHLDAWSAFDLRGASMASLLAHLEETLGRVLRLWDLHFRIVLPSYLAMSQFDDLYRDLFGADEAFGSYRLLQGFDNLTLGAGRALWELSRRALVSTEVRRIVEEHAAEDVMAALDGTPAGRAFQEELRAYLSRYGLRSDRWGLRRPSWIEDPTPAIRTLKEYMASPRPDPRTDQAALAAERDRAVADARARLATYPRPIVERFEFLLAAAQEGVVLSEDHGFWIDFASTYRVRQVILEFGRRLVEAGAIDRPADVLYLTLDELRSAAAASPAGDSRAVVAPRQGEVERFGAVTPPAALGADGGPPPDDPMGRFFAKFWGGPAPASDRPDLLKGNAGSPGTVRGPAKVVRSLDEAGKLAQGDILVAETTAPAWTPLFATAAGIVTDTGGILSHCAVVAREYRIPAVVGTDLATATIRDGQIVEVDGDVGVVRILPG